MGAAFRGLLAVSPAPLSSRPVPALVSALPDVPPLPAVVFRWGALPAVGVNRCSPHPQRAVGGSVPLPQLSGQTHSARNTARGAAPRAAVHPVSHPPRGRSFALGRLAPGPARTGRPVTRPAMVVPRRLSCREAAVVLPGSFQALLPQSWALPHCPGASRFLSGKCRSLRPPPPFPASAAPSHGGLSAPGPRSAPC